MDTNTFTPINKNVLVKMLPREEMHGSIHIPDYSQKTNEWGTVISYADDCEEMNETDVDVYIPPHLGTHLIFERTDDYVLIHESKIIAARS
tara:strand:- start:1074 stop:1346 length:273 start_codon:yes stop_codon:yes gene_type:complete